MIKRVCCVLGVTLLLFSCATQKSRQDQSQFGKFYHNVTSKFNGYFNANEILEESIERLDAQHLDNYNDLLKIYKYRAASNPETVSGDLDEAIKKVSIVATLHEGSDWVDDCYLLIGKSYYLKQDFESAQNALEFFMDEFNPDGTRINQAPSRKDQVKSKTATRSSIAKKSGDKASRRRAKEAERARKEYNKQLRKKQKQSKRGKSGDDGKSDQIVVSKRSIQDDTPEPPQEETAPPPKPPETGPLSHQPAYQEATLWLARTYVERDNYPRAEFYLNKLQGSSPLQDEIKVELPKVWAYYAIHRGNYKGAIPHLQEAITVAEKKRDKARLAFILAQLAEMTDESAQAQEYYSVVLDNNPPYQLEFNAKLSLARTSLAAGDRPKSEIVSSLEKMLKDDKNVDYKDQVYFTLAQINLIDNNVDAAIANLILAAGHGTTNGPQLTETNYLLATLYFEKEDYVNAKAAYDAALATMEKNDERYAYTERLSKNLTEIAAHLTSIAHQDSLLKLSAMSDEELQDLAKEIQKERDRVASATSKENQGASIPSHSSDVVKGGKVLGQPGAAARSGGPQPVVASSSRSNFFAFDPKNVKRGKREFVKQWGDRPLADNWRLASTLVNQSDFEGTLTDEEAPVEEISDSEIADIFKDVPRTDEARAVAHGIIQKAMLELGSLYREKLEDYAQSVGVLEDLLQKYPDTEHKLDAYYQLYLSYMMQGDVAKSNYYKNKIIEEYSQSKYALALSDPDYFAKQLSEEQKLQNAYQEVFDQVEMGNYAEASEMILKCREQYGTNHKLEPKFRILEAMSIGNLEGRDAYVAALKDIVGAYPNTPEETKARDMLLLLGEYKGSRLNLERGQTGAADFRVEPGARHYVLVMIHNYEEVDIQEARLSVHNFNNKYHRLDRLKVNSLVFDPSTKQTLILIRTYKDGDRAMAYQINALKHTDEYLPPNADYDVYPVSEWNYRQIIKQRSLDGYRTFFETNYKAGGTE